MKRLTDSFAFCSCSKPLRAGLWFVQHSLALLRTLRYSLYLSDDLLLWRETGWPHINANKNASCNGDHSIFPLFFFFSPQIQELLGATRWQNSLLTVYFSYVNRTSVNMQALQSESITNSASTTRECCGQFRISLNRERVKGLIVKVLVTAATFWRCTSGHSYIPKFKVALDPCLSGNKFIS